HDRANADSYLRLAVQAKRSAAGLMFDWATCRCADAKGMLTLRRKGVSQKSLSIQRVLHPQCQDAARRQPRFAWAGHSGRSAPAREIGPGAAAEAHRRDHGRQWALGAEAAPAEDGGAPSGDAVGAHYH